MIAFSDCRVQSLAQILRWISARVPRPDLILYAGDDIARFRPNSSTNYFELLAAHARLGLCAVAGNDDDPETRELIAGRDVHAVHSTPYEADGWLVVGLEGSQAPGIGPLQHSSRAITAHLKHSLANSGKKPIIILSHSPPKGCVDRARRFGLRHIGSEALRKAVRARTGVRLIVCGHAHLCGGQSDYCGNAFVLNIASHDNAPDEPAKLAEIVISPDGSLHINTTHLEGRTGTIAAISGIGPRTARRLEAAGLGSLQLLAEANPISVRAKVPSIGTPPEILIARAQAYLAQKPVVIRELTLPPTPRIYFDIETDLRQQRIWLIGCYIEEEDRVCQFLARTFAEERHILGEFKTFVDANPHASFVSFSSNHLDHWLTLRRLKEHGLDPLEPIAANRNAYHLLWRSLALPTTRFGLKDIAAALGYQFKHPNIDGRQVAWEYEYEVQKGRRVPERLLEYNSDDVRALHFALVAAKGLCPRIPLAASIGDSRRRTIL